MAWSEISPPKEGISRYTHITMNSPLGICVIEWKSWKEDEDYSISIDGEFMDYHRTLRDAKELAIKLIKRKRDELSEWLDKQE